MRQSASPTLTIAPLAFALAGCMLLTPAFAQVSSTPVTPVALPPGPVSGTELPKAYVQNMAGFAYLWGWPLVNMHNRRLVFEKVPENGLGDGVLPVGPVNSLTMLTDYIKPEERAVATPNQDVVYGFGLLSLEKEPVVFQVPDFGKRFWIYQLGNQRTDTLGGVGQMYGTKPGFYMIAGPGWKGQTPKGILKVYRSPTNLAFIIPRAFMDDTPEDRQAVQPLVNQIMSYPLSQYDGKVKTKEWSKIPKLSDPAGGSQGGGAETKWVKAESFFEELPLILKEVPPQQGEEALYAQFRALLAAAAKSPEVAATMKQTAMDMDNGLFKEIHAYRYAGVPVDNGWVSPMNGAEFGTDYFSRAAAARANIFVNPRRESAYFGAEYDLSKNRLNGANQYQVTFPKGALPPVKGFWSVTMYDADHFFAPNSLNRFSLGTKNKRLVYNPDGSLTIYVQNARPSDDKVNNWLPAPTGDFELFLRAYWPQLEIMDGKWAPPPVEKKG
jgi:hypothetical protein